MSTVEMRFIENVLQISAYGSLKHLHITRCNVNILDVVYGDYTTFRLRFTRRCNRGLKDNKICRTGHFGPAAKLKMVCGYLPTIGRPLTTWIHQICRNTGISVTNDCVTALPVPS